MLCKSPLPLLVSCCLSSGLTHCCLCVMLRACQVSAAGHCAGQEAAAGFSSTPGAHACPGPQSASEASSKSPPCAVCQAPVASRGLLSPSAQKLPSDHCLAAQHPARSTVSAPAELVHQQVEHPTGAQQLPRALLPQDQRFSAAAVEASWLASAAGCSAGSDQACAEAATADSATWPLHSSAADGQGSWGATAAATLQRLPSHWQLAAAAPARRGPACLNTGRSCGDSQPTWSQASSTCAAVTRLEAAEPWQVCLAARQHQAGLASQGAQALQGEPAAQYRHQTVPLSNLLNSTSTAVDLLSTQRSQQPLFTSPSLDGAPQQAPASQQDGDTACTHISWREAQSSVRPADMARDSSSRSLAQQDSEEEQAACSSGDDSSCRVVRPSEGQFVCCVRISAAATSASTHARAMACRVPRCDLEH